MVKNSCRSTRNEFSERPQNYSSLWPIFDLPVVIGSDEQFFDTGTKTRTNVKTRNKDEAFHLVAVKDKVVESIRDLVVLETEAEHFSKVLENCTVH